MRQLLPFLLFLFYFSVISGQKLPLISGKPESSIIPSRSWQNIKHFSTFEMPFEQYRKYLIGVVPTENNQGNVAPITLPMPDGSTRTFEIMSSTVMESEIQSRYPEIKTFKGTDGTHYMRMICTDHWLKAYVLDEAGDIIIEPYSTDSKDWYGVYYSNDINIEEAALSRICGESGHNILRQELNKSDRDNQLISRTVLGSNPVSLITYRIAVSCTGEFGQAPALGGGSVATIIAKIADALTYANAVYEKDFAIHFNMANNNDRIVFTDPDTDPFENNGSGGFLLGQNTTIVNARGGTFLYDIGHVFTNSCTDVGGIANLGVVCSKESKANGVTCWYTSDVAYVAQRIFCHEMGHQFSASHTFSNCNGNESGTMYEPGGGTTIMSYQGLCGALNLESTNPPHPNFFHSCSLEQVIGFTRVGVTCGTKSDPSNTYPVSTVLTKPNLTIPVSTPFELKGLGSDMEDTTLTYNWEQYDNGPYGSALGDVSSTGPLFRVFFPSKTPNRTFPQWSSIFNSPPTNPNYDVREVLPAESRNLNFRFVVRDNHPGAGGSSYSSLSMKVTDQAGPFKITFPNTTADKLYKNACNRISWDVANTFNLPVNCKKVDIFLIRNREVDKPIILKSNTDNDGNELVDIPDLGTNVRVRVCVRAADHIFFDISDRDITIIDAATSGVNMGLTPNVVNVCLPQVVEVKIRSCSFGSYSGQLKLFVESGIPQGSTYQFAKEQLSSSDETTLSINANNLTQKSSFLVTVGAVTEQGDTLRDQLTVNAIKNDFSDQKLLYPQNGNKDVLETPLFKWNKSINASQYTIEIATNPSFGTSVVYTQSNISADSFLLPLVLKENTIYYWRLIPLNDCGAGNSTSTFAFQTIRKVCLNQSYTGNPVNLSRSKTHAIKIPLNFNGTVSDINFNNVEVEADAVKDVVLSLISPTGTKVRLFNQNCGVTLDFLCSFDDDAPIALTCPPTMGLRMQPFEPLRAFNGQSLSGDWTFEVITNSSFSSGTIRNFTLQYCAELKPNNPFNVNGGPLRLNVGETKLINSSSLLSQDNDNTPSQLVYTLVSATQKGDLLLNSVKLSIGSTFTQKDIDDGKLSYHHTGSISEIDEFNYTVQDGTGGWYGVSSFDIFIGAVATNDRELDKKWQVFPNPGSGLFQINFTEPMEKNTYLRVINTSGQLVLKLDVSGSNDSVLDLNSLSDGVYMLALNNQNGASVRKLIIAR